MENVIVVLKNMSLALFFSGCNHYKSIHFAAAKIQLIFQIQQKKFTILPPRRSTSYSLLFPAYILLLYLSYTLVILYIIE